MRSTNLGTFVTLAAMVVVLGLVTVIGSGTAHASFNPAGSFCLNDQATLPLSVNEPPCDGSHAPGAHDAFAGRFGVGNGPNGRPGGGDDVPDTNFGGVINFTPPEWGVARGGDIPDGAFVGRLNSIATLGLLGNPCRQFLPVEFDLLDASIDPSDTIAVLAPGESDRLQTLARDDNGNGVLDGAEKWPDYLNDFFEDEIAAGIPDPLANIRARLFGVNITSVSGLTIVLNFLLFEPGTELSEHFYVDSRLGYPSVTVLQDPTAPASGDDPVNDFCSPLLSVTNTFGLTIDNPSSIVVEGGKPYRTNAGEGAYNFVTFSASQPDADGDGIENALDPCPYDPDPDWDPRSPSSGRIAGDRDADGLPDSCDPYPDIPSEVVGSIRDEDFDGWMNRSDNCPIVYNPDNEDDDGDTIGDACDQNIGGNVGTIDGDIIYKCTVTTVTIGAGGTPAVANPQSLAPCDPNAPDDAGGADGDGDGEQEVVVPKKVEKEVKAGETVTTDEEGDGATADDPVEVWVTSPIGDTISIEITDMTVTPPQGFQFLSWQVEISGPDATPDDPLIIVFQLDSSILDGENENTIQIFKDGVQVADCSDASGMASPDPCVSDRALLSDGDVEITVLTSTASSWNFGVPKQEVAGEVTGPDTGAAGGAATGEGSLAPVASSIPAWAAIASALGGAGLLGSLAAFVNRIIRRRR